MDFPRTIMQIGKGSIEFEPTQRGKTTLRTRFDNPPQFGNRNQQYDIVAYTYLETER